MAEEVYKILQGRLRLKQAQENTCGDQYDCEGCLNHVSTKQQLDESARRKRNSNSTTGEVSKKNKIKEIFDLNLGAAVLRSLDPQIPTGSSIYIGPPNAS